MHHLTTCSTVHGTVLGRDPGSADRPAVPPAPADPERGDVPGWVLVTLMTAGLVLALWAVAGPALIGVFESAIARVTAF